MSLMIIFALMMLPSLITMETSKDATKRLLLIEDYPAPASTT